MLRLHRYLHTLISSDWLVTLINALLCIVFSLQGLIISTSSGAYGSLQKRMSYSSSEFSCVSRFFSICRFPFCSIRIEIKRIDEYLQEKYLQLTYCFSITKCLLSMGRLSQMTPATLNFFGFGTKRHAFCTKFLHEVWQRILNVF